MPLPFFKRRRNADGTIDIRARAVVGAAVPPAVCTQAAPDLGDYGTDYPEPLPHYGRLLPVLFWTALLGLAAAYAYTLQAGGTLRQESRLAQDRLRQEAVRKTALDSQLKSITGKLDDLHVLTRWVDLLSPVRDIVVAVLQSANERIQIRSLELQRKEPTVLRYNLQVICTGSQQNFDAMQADLKARLADAGWTVTENPAETDDTRLMVDFSLVRKSN
jgi:hypothetical protein